MIWRAQYSEPERGSLAGKPSLRNLLPHPTLRQNRAGGKNAVIYEIDPRLSHGKKSIGIGV